MNAPAHAKLATSPDARGLSPLLIERAADGFASGIRCLSRQVVCSLGTLSLLHSSSIRKSRGKEHVEETAVLSMQVQIQVLEEEKFVKWCTGSR
jgi:hypothetical protein